MILASWRIIKNNIDSKKFLNTRETKTAADWQHHNDVVNYKCSFNNIASKTISNVYNDEQRTKEKHIETHKK